jgi:hypothetical protein
MPCSASGKTAGAPSAESAVSPWSTTTIIAPRLLRGQLCRRCNTREGREEGPLWDSYRARPPAVILGVKEVYWSPITGYAEPEPEPTSTPNAQAASLLNFPWPPKDG